MDEEERQMRSPYLRSSFVLFPAGLCVVLVGRVVFVANAWTGPGRSQNCRANQEITCHTEGYGARELRLPDNNRQQRAPQSNHRDPTTPYSANICHMETLNPAILVCVPSDGDAARSDLIQPR
ncbi:uncharacterized protein V6R79_000500 [Siganus canaliculatus]